MKVALVVAGKFPDKGVSETGVYSKAGNRAIQHQLQILGSYTLNILVSIASSEPLSLVQLLGVSCW